MLPALLLAGVLALACAPAGSAQGGGEPCQRAPVPGDSVIALESEGTQRTALLHIPPAPAGERLPLLVALHGAGGAFFAPYSGFSTMADAEGFIALYPNPREEADGRKLWNIDEAPWGPDDVQFIAALLNYVETNLCVDSTRVYAAGVSNGGGMAALLACQLSERFAAIASIAGGYSSLPPCNPTDPVSVIEVHGTADPVVPYDGKPPDGAGAVLPWLADWRARDGCTAERTVARIAPRVLRYEWDHCAAGTTVAHVEIYGGGHQLPGGLPPDPGQASTVSAPWLVWSFLRGHRLAAS